MEESLKANTKMARRMATERMTYPDGRVFEGAYKDGMPNGHGKMTSPDGSSYEGECKDGSATWPRKMTYPDGRPLKANSKMASGLALKKGPSF